VFCCHFCVQYFCVCPNKKIRLNGKQFSTIKVQAAKNAAAPCRPIRKKQYFPLPKALERRLHPRQPPIFNLPNLSFYMFAIENLLGQTDIYLVDQIMQQRYQPGQRLLDAGCGSGRNLHWFVLHGQLQCYACDHSAASIDEVKQVYPQIPDEHFTIASLEQLPYPEAFFHHIICNAVLHFASNETQFLLMLHALCRVLKPGGSLFIRTASDIGIEKEVQPLSNGRYLLPDGSERFLLTKALLHQINTKFPLQHLAPFKTSVVQHLRSMSTLVLQKKDSIT
jgi:ubiquinone/menaquinone biosynthesis C-methylase UbiE